MSRKDKLSRQLTATDRRKRRNLDDFPRAIRGAAVPPENPTACPNIGPADAGPEHCTPQGTGAQTGAAYVDVMLNEVAVDPGLDTISYCYDGRVGPGTGPIECYCDGELGLITNGLIYDTGYGFTDDSWENELKIVGGAAFYRYQDPSGFWWLQTDGIGQQLSVPTAYYIYPNNMVPHDEMWVGANLSWYGSGGKWYCNWDIDSDPTTIGHRGHIGAMACMTGENFDGWGVDDAHAHGIFGCTSGWALVLWNGLASRGTADSNNAASGKPSLWKQNSSSDTTTVRADDNQAGSSPELTTTNATKDGQSGRMAVYCWQDVGNEGGGFRIAHMFACTSRVVRMQGLPTGYYAQITGMQRTIEWITPPAYLPSSSTQESGGIVDIDFGEVHAPFSKWKIYDGDPGGGGNLVLECEIPRGIWGGDVYEYFPNGDCNTSETLTNAEGYIEMEVYDINDTLLHTNTPAAPSTITTTAWARKNGVLNYALPLNAWYLRFTPKKTGTADAFACFQKLQVNTGGICCAYADPSTGGELSLALIHYPGDLIVAEGGDATADGYAGERLIQTVWDQTRLLGWTGEEIGDSYDEHHQGTQNIMGFDATSEQNGPGEGVSGDAEWGCGYVYDAIDIDDFGLTAGTDTISLRFKAKVV